MAVPKARPKIMIVDDDPAIRQVVEMALNDEGYDVVSAAHGAAALRLLSQDPPSLILLDMRMPVMDGWEFARRYHEQPFPRAPIVVLTASLDLPARAAPVDADAYLDKPFELERLLELVATYTR